ncbi:hypothetical protein [Lachnoclostridium sp. An131]|uniref:hypothetical protein n=1 Tax=Lachnoclostridium sp. An131 TaxID=1965555 RepID=UPI0013A644D4|nr:hypothetical protein [Lachnoclostridium sp. An131]
MYSIWFHQIKTLAGREPGILDSLTPEKLEAGYSAKKEAYHEFYRTGAYFSQPDRAQHF